MGCQFWLYLWLTYALQIFHPAVFIFSPMLPSGLGSKNDCHFSTCVVLQMIMSHGAVQALTPVL